jgi:plasmid stabilization system protein ParE
MEQEYQVIFSKHAASKLDGIVAYLNDNWSQQVKIDFLALLADKLQLISKMPFMYRASVVLPGCRECILNHVTILYYRVDENQKLIEVVTIQSTRTGEIS